MLRASLELRPRIIITGNCQHGIMKETAAVAETSHYGMSRLHDDGMALSVTGADLGWCVSVSSVMASGELRVVSAHA